MTELPAIETCGNCRESVPVDTQERTDVYYCRGYGPAAQGEWPTVSAKWPACSLYAYGGDYAPPPEPKTVTEMAVYDSGLESPRAKETPTESVEGKGFSGAILVALESGPMTSAAIVEEIRGKVNTKVAPENFAKNVSVTLCYLQHKKLVQKAGNEYSLTE
mgnify:FL=1